MKTFEQFMQMKTEAVPGQLAGQLPNFGQRAIPMTQGQAQNPTPQTQTSAPKGQPQQISLSSLASKVKDPNWHQLYGNFSHQQPRTPNDPKIQQMGQALYQSAQTGNMSALKPFIQQQVHAQPMQPMR